jgi:NADPH:quinone reductase-like Zn-dependent oxidoreductase
MRCNWPIRKEWVVATASANDAEYLRELGADQVIDYRTAVPMA